MDFEIKRLITRKNFVGNSFLTNEIHFNTSKVDHIVFEDFTDQIVYFTDQISP